MDQSDPGKQQKRGGRKPGECVPKTNVTPKINVKWEGMDDHIKHMKEHALIMKFIDIWPPERTLVGWIEKN